MLSACPLMHGTGQFSSLIAMNARRRGRHAAVAASSTSPSCGTRSSGCRSTRSSSSARPSPARCSTQLDADPGSYDLSSVLLISSSGVMWSQENKDGLLRHIPQRDPVRLVRLVRGGRPGRLGVGRRARRSETAKFMLGRTCRGVHRRRPAGRAGLAASSGMVAVSGFIPLGYYKDEAKTAPDVPHVRGPALERARRLGRGERRRHAAPARPRLGVHQHRRREGLPRGGRGGAEDAPGRARRGVPSGCPTRASARRSAPWSRPTDGATPSTSTRSPST